MERTKLGTLTINDSLIMISIADKNVEDGLNGEVIEVHTSDQYFLVRSIFAQQAMSRDSLGGEKWCEGKKAAS